MAGDVQFKKRIPLAMGTSGHRISGFITATFCINVAFFHCDEGGKCQNNRHTNNHLKLQATLDEVKVINMHSPRRSHQTFSRSMNTCLSCNTMKT